MPWLSNTLVGTKGPYTITPWSSNTLVGTKGRQSHILSRLGRQIPLWHQGGGSPMAYHIMPWSSNTLVALRGDSLLGLSNTLVAPRGWYSQWPIIS